MFFEDCLRAAIASAVSLTVLFLLTKLMGKRQVAQLSMFDYINGITIGSITAELATADRGDYAAPLTGMIIFAVAAALMAIASNKSIVARKVIVGKPTILYENDTIFEKNLAKAKLDVNEFLTACRCQGYFSLDDIHTAILETNGQISFLLKSAARPLTPDDVELSPSEESLSANLVIDGHIMPDCLRVSGKDEAWLKKQLDAQNVKLEDALLATCDGDGVFNVYEKTGEEKKKDVFL